MTMSNSAALEYAASWGSFMSSGDPGACMYGFSDDFVMQSEQHRADCLAYLAGCRQFIIDRPGDYEDGELSQMDEFIETVKAAKTEEDKLYSSSSSGNIEIEFTVAQILSIPRTGAADSAVAELLKDPGIAAQLAELKPETVADELREYGAWDDDELADHDANLSRIVYHAVTDLREENEL